MTINEIKALLEEAKKTLPDNAVLGARIQLRQIAESQYAIPQEMLKQVAASIAEVQGAIANAKGRSNA